MIITSFENLQKVQLFTKFGSCSSKNVLLRSFQSSTQNGNSKQNMFISEFDIFDRSPAIFEKKEPFFCSDNSPTSSKRKVLFFEDL